MPTPAHFGRYEVIEPLGQGAMGAVYKARDPAIDRLVAVKTVGAALLAFPEHQVEFLARFKQEARAAGRLSHPRIVSVYDVGVDAATGTPYIVMEYVGGVSLATVLQENPMLPVDQAIEIVVQVGSALDAAHAKGIVHRDIKPGNILLDKDGSVKVADFGIARMEGSELTQTGVGLGTPGYLAPEVLRGERADARSDLFALGVVAYTLLTGRRPFEGQTRETVGIQVLQHDPAPPHAVRPEVPPGVSDAVMKALAKSPDARTPSVAWFLADLRTTAVPAAILPGGRRRRIAVLAGLVAAGALLVGAAVLATRFWRDEGAAAAPRSVRPVTPTTHATARPPADEAPAAEAREPDRGRPHGKGKKKGHDR